MCYKCEFKFYTFVVCTFIVLPYMYYTNIYKKKTLKNNSDNENTINDNNDINMMSLNLDVNKDFLIEKKNIENNNRKKIMDDENQLKNDLTNLIKSNLIKQYIIDDENVKYLKYFDIIKKENKLKFENNDNNEIINFVKQKLPFKNNENIEINNFVKN